MIFKGKAHKFGDDINTDYIIPAKYKGQTKDFKAMSRFLMSEIAPDFVKNIRPGDFLVAGENFGCGSSREAAPLVIREAGIAAVIAVSFGRIFYRNAINIGLPVIECDTDFIDEGNLLDLDLQQGRLTNATTGRAVDIKPLPPFIRNILAEGGILNYLKTHELII